jgi:UDP-glucose:(glucosyl)LPS alpha-1,2-glucosyltransferase
MKPSGGTELQENFLTKNVDQKLLDKFQICTSVPEKIPLAKDKINILWQKNAPNQPNIEPWFSNPDNHQKYDWYVFNSHWNYEKYRYMFNIPTHKCHVIKNGVTSFPAIKKYYKKGDTLRLIFHPTPWRGLNVLLATMQLLEKENIELDVYSSCEIYGDEFKRNNDSQYVDLYQQADELKNVNYIGYRPNDFILKKLPYYHMFAYPSIWEETSCISLLECMAAGLYCIVTNYGALYETGAEFPVYVNYETNFKNLAHQFAEGIKICRDTLHEPVINQHLVEQQKYVKRYYSWEKKKLEWTNFLYGVYDAK